MTLDEFWKQKTGHAYLEGGYFEDKPDPDAPHLPHALRLEYVQKLTVDGLASAMASALSKTQARAFYNHSRAFESQLKSGRISWQQCRAEITKMEGIVQARKKKHKVPVQFCEFIQRNLEATQTQRDFLEGFVPHFEALINFGAEYFSDRDPN